MTCSTRRIPRFWSWARCSVPSLPFLLLRGTQTRDIRKGRVLVENWNWGTNFIHSSCRGKFTTNNGMIKSSLCSPYIVESSSRSRVKASGARGGSCEVISLSSNIAILHMVSPMYVLSLVVHIHDHPLPLASCR